MHSLLCLWRPPGRGPSTGSPGGCATRRTRAGRLASVGEGSGPAGVEEQW